MSQKESAIAGLSSATPVGPPTGRKVRVDDCLGIAQTEGVGGNEKTAGPEWGKTGWLAL